MVELQHPNGHVSYFRAGTGMNRNKVERFILKQGYTKVTGANVFSKEVRGDGVKTASIYLMDDLSKLD